MKCSELQTTSCARTADDAVRSRDAVAARAAAAQFEALLLHDVVAPLGRVLGPMIGDLAADSFARAIARADRNGLAQIFERALAPHDDMQGGA